VSFPPISTCKKCKAEFKQMDAPFRYFKICLDCRMELGDIARRPGGKDVVEYMNSNNGFRIVRGFILLTMGYDDE